jgi:hypothetical protein|tara:strand:- start:231 stop:434 length:204 start_codon:yes stop_codon:yes gene_type:complete
MLKKYREKISQAMHLAFYPWGVDKEFDEQSSKSFLRFLDVIYYVGLALIFSVPFMSLTILVLQKNGS